VDADRPNDRRIGARLVGILTIGAGIAIIAATVLSHSFSRAEAGQDATDLVRFELSPDGLRQHRADFELVRDAVQTFFREALPRIAEGLREDPADLRAELAARFESLARYATDETIAADVAFAEGIVSNLERHREDFADADSIPLGSLPMTAGPWVAVAAAGLLVAVGIAVVVRPRAGSASQPC
jgi:hypothetical protein